MKKFKVIDMCAGMEDRVREDYVEDVIGSWEDYYEELCAGSLDGVDFELEDIDESLFILDDGGEALKLKDGRYMNVCWRGNACHIWEEEDPEYLNEF